MIDAPADRGVDRPPGCDTEYVERPEAQILGKIVGPGDRDALARAFPAHARLIGRDPERLLNRIQCRERERHETDIIHLAGLALDDLTVRCDRDAARSVPLALRRGNVAAWLFVQERGRLHVELAADHACQKLGRTDATAPFHESLDLRQRR
ncbi:MAG: hypothetical protein AAF409_20220 [Pseudomonadota bacterium]